METLKIEKTIEEIPLERAVDLVSQALDKPKDLNEENWQNQIKEDLLTGKKFFTLRELKLSKREI